MTSKIVGMAFLLLLSVCVSRPDFMLFSSRLRENNHAAYSAFKASGLHPEFFDIVQRLETGDGQRAVIVIIPGLLGTQLGEIDATKENIFQSFHVWPSVGRLLKRGARFFDLMQLKNTGCDRCENQGARCVFMGVAANETLPGPNVDISYWKSSRNLFPRGASPIDGGDTYSLPVTKAAAKVAMRAIEELTGLPSVDHALTSDQFKLLRQSLESLGWEIGVDMFVEVAIQSPLPVLFNITPRFAIPYDFRYAPGTSGYRTQCDCDSYHPPVLDACHFQRMLEMIQSIAKIAGRKVVIVTHSNGSNVATQLLRSYPAEMAEIVTRFISIAGPHLGAGATSPARAFPRLIGTRKLETYLKMAWTWPSLSWLLARTDPSGKFSGPLFCVHEPDFIHHHKPVPWANGECISNWTVQQEYNTHPRRTFSLWAEFERNEQLASRLAMALESNAIIISDHADWVIFRIGDDRLIKSQETVQAMVKACQHRFPQFEPIQDRAGFLESVFTAFPKSPLVEFFLLEPRDSYFVEMVTLFARAPWEVVITSLMTEDQQRDLLFEISETVPGFSTMANAYDCLLKSKDPVLALTASELNEERMRPIQSIETICIYATSSPTRTSLHFQWMHGKDGALQMKVVHSDGAFTPGDNTIPAYSATYICDLWKQMGLNSRTVDVTRTNPVAEAHAALSFHPGAISEIIRSSVL